LNTFDIREGGNTGRYSSGRDAIWRNRGRD
jgi:hypothetical protein